MFDLNSKTPLSAAQTLELVQIQLGFARECKDDAIKLTLCKYADKLLEPMKKVVKRPTTNNNNHSSNPNNREEEEKEQTLRESIATAYLDHANLVADLGLPDLAQTSRRRADKWGGPGTKKTTVTAVNKKKAKIDIAAVSDSIFPMDVPPPTLSWSFPEPDSRVADTPQLVSCLGLLKQGSDAILDNELEQEARIWRKETSQNPDERARLEVLATDLIRAFTQDEIKDRKVIAEVICLVPVLEVDDSRFLLGQFLDDIKDSSILSIGALRGLAHVLRTATPGHLFSQDLIEVLGPMSTKLQNAHSESPEYIFELTVAVSSVLDAMTDAKVTGIKRVEMHEPLLVFLASLRNSDDPHLKFHASYAFQALLCVPNDESPWEATVRRTTKVVKGISGLVSAVKGLDLNAFMTGLQNVQEGFDGIQQLFELGKTAYEGVSAVYESEQDFVASLKEGLTFNRRRAWYRALRGADTLLEEGELKKFKDLVCGAVCRCEVEFQWGVCQRLGRVAANSRWGIETRQGAVRFLEEIYRKDAVWGHLPPIKSYIIELLKQLSVTVNDLPDVSQLIKDLADDGDAVKQDVYRSSLAKEIGSGSRLSVSGLPEFAQPSLLDRVQRKTDVEVDLRRLARQRIKERGGAVYVPPMAKPHSKATDDELFPLIPAVDEFLDGNKKVLLLLGDSGAGKTTFNRELDLKLWKAYMEKPKTARVPLFISLPAINRPEQDLIAKHLRICEFSEPQIREMKDREIVIICDGYDESQQFQNLYESNGFNKDGGWHVQMIISCRSEHLGQDYRDLFQPARTSSTDPDLFKQAILVPFSMDQITEYIDQYVKIKGPLWESSDYKRVLDQIPSLQDLVTNPFLLSLSLEVLPRITDPNQKLAANRITRVLLYDEFVAQWMERNKKRLAVQGLSEQERKAFESLSDDGFTQQGLIFLKNLSAAIYDKQDGNPVVQYSKARDAGTWKAEFFGRHDEEVQLLRMAIPLTRNGGRFGFVHRSILEYGVSRAIYEPLNQTGIKLQTEVETTTQLQRRTSVSSAYSFEAESRPAPDDAGADPAEEGPDLDSLLAKRSFVKDSSVIQFLVDRVQSEPKFKDQLHKYIELSKTEKKWRIGAANAITILVRAGIHFSHHDLRGIQVPNADMSFGVFDSAQLQGADLRKANLQSAWIRQTDLSQARMSGARFGEWPTLNDAKMSTAFAYTPDGQKFVAGTMDGRILVYNTNSWAICTTLTGHNQEVTDLAISGDSTLLVSGASMEKTSYQYSAARVWDVTTGECLHLLDGHHGEFRGFFFSPSNRQLITGSRKGIHLWEVKSGDRVHNFEVPEDVRVDTVACSPDWKVMASAHADGTLRFWNLENFECLRVLNTAESNSVGAIFSPDGKLITLTFYVTREIKTWEVATGTEIWSLEGNRTILLPPKSWPDIRPIASIDGDTISLLDQATGKIGQIFHGHNAGEVWNFTISWDKSQVAVAYRDRTVRLFDLQTGAPGPIFEGHDDHANAVVFSANGRQIASCSYSEKTIRLWNSGTSETVNLQSWKPHRASPKVCFGPGESRLMSLGPEGAFVWGPTGDLMNSLERGKDEPFTILATSPCGLQVAIGTKEQSTVRLWNAETGQSLELDMSPGLDRYIKAAFSNGNRLAISNWSRGLGAEVRIWDRSTGALECQLTGHDLEISNIVFSPNQNQQQLATSSTDLTVRLWDLSTGRCSWVLKGFRNDIAMVVYSPDGSQVFVSCKGDGMVEVYDVVTGNYLRYIDPGRQSPLIFTPDSSLYMTYSSVSSPEVKGTLQVWDTVSGKQVRTLGNTNSWTTAAVSSDGQLLVSSSEGDRVIRLWDLKTGQQITQIDNCRDKVVSLALDRPTGCGEGAEGDDGPYHEWSLAVATLGGEVSSWRLKRRREISNKGTEDAAGTATNSTSSPMSHTSGRAQRSSEKNIVNNAGDHGADEIAYEFTLLWTTGFGKLNAEGAVLDSVKGLSRANTLLLKQNGAQGEPVPPIGFRGAISKVMSKNILARLGSSSLIKDGKGAVASSSSSGSTLSLQEQNNVKEVKEDN
ncbi:hypothetical protein BGZ83_005545 [Gryganskiella cystojenkinii]|nr:hypothetical protein BGZ83_005545 [Gryganskiella cystojenkinii]